jgi:hypothetical protein
VANAGRCDIGQSRRARRDFHPSICEDDFQDTGYNPPQPMLKVIRVSSVLLLCLAAPFAHAAGKWDAQVAELSRKIIALNGSTAASLEIKNASSLPVDEFISIRRALEDQLKSSGLQIRNNAQGSIRVTLSENVRGLLWVAEVQQGSETKVGLVAIPKTDAGGATASALVLRRSLLIGDKEQILDAAIWQSRDQRFLLVLGPSLVGIFRANGARWESATSVSIPHTVYPRDLRGRLWMGRDGDWKAFLPGIQCTGAPQLQQPMTCHDSDDPWYLTEKYKAFYNSARNHFTGAMVPPLTRSFPNFYTASQPRHGNSEFWVFSGTDGQHFSFDGSTTRVLAGTRDWGSDAASVKSGCGPGTQLLVSGAGDDSVNDTIRAYEVGDRDARPVSPPLAFDGTVTALWTTTDGDSAVAVIRTQTGSYEAYSVSVACNQ